MVLCALEAPVGKVALVLAASVASRRDGSVAVLDALLQPAAFAGDDERVQCGSYHSCLWMKLDLTVVCGQPGSAAPVYPVPGHASARRRWVLYRAVGTLRLPTE